MRGADSARNKYARAISARSVALLAFCALYVILFSGGYSYLGVGWREPFSKMVPADLFDSTCSAGTLRYDFGASDLSGWLLCFFLGAPIFFGSAGHNMRDLKFEISGLFFFSRENSGCVPYERVVNKTVAELGELTAS